MVLRSKIIAAHDVFDIHQHLFGLERLVQHLPSVAPDDHAVFDLEPLSFLGNCRQIDMDPVLAAAKQVAHQIIVMQTLGNDDDHVFGFVVEP